MLVWIFFFFFCPFHSNLGSVPKLGSLKLFIYLFFVLSKFKSWFRPYTRSTDSNSYLSFLKNILKKVSEAATG